MERDEILIGDEQGLGKTKESIDITVARKRDLCKCLIVCGVNSVKYNWEAEIKTHSKEKSVMLDQKTMPLRVKALNEWLRGGGRSTTPLLTLRASVMRLYKMLYT